jgi:Cysteine-rich secretory protein family/LysM domain
MKWKLLLLMICLFGLVTLPAQAQDTGDLLGRINSLRAQKGLPGYSINGALSVAAQQQAQWIVDTGTVAHTHPDGSGPRTRALTAGYPNQLIGENIYGGTNASTNDAWVFWINSPIHYQGLVNPAYQEVGIGIAHGGWGSAFVLDFGGSGAPYVPASSGGSNNGKGGSQGGPVAPPAYVGGVDENGNIKHIVQAGDTLGDIALLYGYSWSDLPYMMQLNGLANVRDLEVGSIFLVPPKGGTLTPTTDTRPPTETPVPTAIPATITPYIVASATLPPDITELTVIAPPLIATAGGNIVPPDNGDGSAETAEAIAFVPTSAATPELVLASVVPQRGGASSWIVIAVGVQAMVVVGAGIEFIRRTLKKRK